MATAAVAAGATAPGVVHALPGRVRIRMPGWTGVGPRRLESELRGVRGVRRATANPLTGTVLVHFDPALTDTGRIVTAARAFRAPRPPARGLDAPPLPAVVHERRGDVRRARIAVRGLDRDPAVLQTVVARLARRPGVRTAVASVLTGRVLVEFIEDEVTLDDLLVELSDIESPPAPGEERLGHALDPALLVQSATRMVAAALGLATLAALRLVGGGRGAWSPAATRAAAMIGLLQSIPAVRGSLRALLGRTRADLVLGLPGIVTLTLAGNPVGLALAGAEALRLYTEARARREAWRAYEERSQSAPAPHPGARVRIESGQRAPLDATVVEGTGIAIGPSGYPAPVVPGSSVPAGAPLFGGNFVVELYAGAGFAPRRRSHPPPRSFAERYIEAIGLVSLACAVVTGIATRSLGRALAAMLLVNGRPAMVGMDAADLGAMAHVLRAGVVVVGTRRRPIRRPDLLLLDSPRVVTRGLEVAGAEPLVDYLDATAVVRLAAGIAAAAGSPWGDAFRGAAAAPATEGGFDGVEATAVVAGVRHTLAHDAGHGALSGALAAPARLRHAADDWLVLRGGTDQHPLGVVFVRPRLAPDLDTLVDCCRCHGVELAMSPDADPVRARAVARRAGIELAEADPLTTIRRRQARGDVVACVADGADAAAAFAACDLAIALTDGSQHFPARADLLAPNLSAVAAVVDAGARRDAAARDAVAVSIAANVAGLGWDVRGRPDVRRAGRVGEVASLAALVAAWLRFHGGARARSVAVVVADPQPERWGRPSLAVVLAAFDSAEGGLTSAQAAARRRAAAPEEEEPSLLAAVIAEARTPLIGVLAAGGAIALLLGALADAAIIAATIAVNVGVGGWQAHSTGRVADALRRMGTGSARALRDGRAVAVAADEVVPGDVLVLTPGDRIAADARVLSADGLEVDEAALTGESLPVLKAPHAETDAQRIVLEGSDVTVGTGTALVVAVGEQTRMGATAAALALGGPRESPLGARLARLFREVVPIAVGGGALATLAGIAWGRPVGLQAATGASIALAAFPEGLPMMAAAGQAGVARRLARRRALVRRLAAVEALGRVDVACVDKTGTLTAGRLALHLVADGDAEATVGDASAGGALPPRLLGVLLAAALASPHPDARDAASHPTDVAVTHGALDAGLGDALRAPRAAEARFDPGRAFHATVAQGRLYAKGAPEVLAGRCVAVRRNGRRRPLDDAGRAALLRRARDLAARGLRVLLIAEGPADASVDDPRGLAALGFVGIRDPLRPGVPAAVRRCHGAGVRVVMLTGDHPATAAAIARDAGLLDGAGVITGAELAGLENGDLDRRLERVTVIARATPLDKLRIVESLQRRGHVVAMTGDGVNDAPALRLADVGVAMGRGGTEVARRAADVVLADDDFATLAETLVEGRGFWHNVRRALGLLLGGNLGELALMLGASLVGAAAPLTVRQILATNLITDALPAFAVVTQQPEHRDLALLAREGSEALDAPLRQDILRRAVATAVPATAAYLLALRSGSLPQARTVAFSSVVVTQLAQTVGTGWSEGTLTPSVLGAVGASAGALAAILAVPALRAFFEVALPSPFGWTLIAVSAPLGPALNRLLAAASEERPRALVSPLPAPAQ